MIVTTLASAFLLVPGPVPSQVSRQVPGAAEERTLPTSLEGVVRTREGLPVAGALVVTSAGGRTSTAEDGSFRIEVALAAGTEQLELSAAHGGKRSFAVLAGIRPGAANPAGVVTLELGVGCQPAWVPTFGQKPGMDYQVQTLAVFDEGNGPTLFAGGSFMEAGSVPAFHVARWNGWNWTPMGTGLGGDFGSGGVYALAVSDVGGSPQLYAGGDSSSHHNVARWTGSGWSQLGSGIPAFVNALASFDDGSGPALYAGGGFGTLRWDGVSWSAVGSVLGGPVYALVVFDDGTGPALYAGGDFTSVGGVSASRLARWNGTSWSALGSGANGSVRSLAVFGGALHAGGSFTSVGGSAANAIARWDGASWSALAGGLTGGPPTPTVSALAAFDDGAGPALFAGGNFTLANGANAPRIARWDGTSWSSYGNFVEGSVNALVAHDDGRGAGPALVAGGSFVTADGVPVQFIAQRSSASWRALGTGADSGVEALLAFDDGGGPALYAGGAFGRVGGVEALRIARWDGTSWSPLGSGVSDLANFAVVQALATYDDGGGEALYAGGEFTLAGGSQANRIARWDGTSWTSLGSGISGGTFPAVHALAVFDDGSGPALYAGGRFTQAGGVPASGIARWDGAAWSPLGSGLSGSSPPVVYALEVFDDGSGPALYAAGQFNTAGGVSARSIARWDGADWSPVGSGVSSPGLVLALAVFDGGSGPALHAGCGQGSPIADVIRWDGASWSALGGGHGVSTGVADLAIFDDGSGPALYAGGGSNSSGHHGITRWNGDSWANVGSGVTAWSGVIALAVFDSPGPEGPALVMGGDFEAVPDSGDSYLALWQGCAGGGQSDSRFGTSLSAADVNGDEFSDVIVGEPLYDGALVDEGRVLVYLGSASGLAATPAWSLRGHQRGAHFGAAVAGVGDVNADGYGDVAVGAPGFDVSRQDHGPGPGATHPGGPAGNSGLLVVFLGSPAGLLGPPALFRPGIQVAERLGTCVARAGDVNGDGFDDVLVGAPGTDGLGAAFVFHGSSAGVEALPRWFVRSPTGSPGTRFATAVGGGGDVNGDGFDDVVVGAPDAGVKGRAYVYHGSPFGLSPSFSWDTGNLPAGDHPASADGNSDWGASVAMVSDANGNGRAEVAVGNPHYDGDTSNCCPVPTDIGAVKLFARSDTGSGAVVTTKGDGAFFRRGVSVADLGDVNADGYAETGIGDGHELGGSLCRFGHSAYWLGAANLFGRGSLASAGDIDGDGFDDVISADPSWGIVYVYRGSASGLAFSGTRSSP